MFVQRYVDLRNSWSQLADTQKIHPEIQNFARLADERHKTMDDLEIAFNEPKVVVTTCLGINQ